jgi:sugar phosphate isomerase/epimerase
MDEKVRLSRRGFVGAAAGAAAASAATWAPAASARGGGGGGALLPRSNIGIQLWTVRDQKDAIGFDALFRALSRQGYKEIEFAGYNGQGRRWSNQELRSLLRRYRLKAIGSHVGYTSDDPNAYTFVTQLDQVLEDAAEIGMPFIGTASNPGDRFGQTVDGYKRAAEDFNRFGAAARELGLRFYQHNHFDEFKVVDGQRLYDVILAETDPRLVFFEMDIFWAHVGQTTYPGFRPHDYPWRMPERFPLFHVKDGTFDRLSEGETEGWTMTDVGAGQVPLEPFFYGLVRDEHHFLAERDTFPPDGTFAGAERDYDWMAGLREQGG